MLYLFVFNFEKVLDEWFPNFTCQACGKEIFDSDNPYLCAECLQSLPIVTEPQVGHYSPFYYAEPVRSLILSLKHSSNGYATKALAPYLVALYLQKIQNNNTHIIVPIPLHPKREQERGYNQCLLLAQAFTEYVNLPIITDVLLRSKNTIMQKHMDAPTRANNMKDAFSINTERVDKIYNQNIILLDDVYTTGATTNSASKVLLENGAHSVTILTVASAQLDSDLDSDF